MRSNPTALRLNISHTWRSEISSERRYQAYTNTYFNLENWVTTRFRRYQEKSSNGFIFSHFKISNFSNKHLRLDFFFYDGALQELFFEIFDSNQRKFQKTILSLHSKRRKKRYKSYFRTYGRLRRFTSIRISKDYLAYLIRKIRWKKFLKFVDFALLYRSLSILKRLKLNIQRICKVDSVSVSVYSAEKEGIRAPMVARYIVGSLVNRFTMAGTVYKLIRGLVRTNKFVPGIMVHCSGRFSRRERATFKRFSRGILRLRKFSYPLDYESAHLTQKFGVVGIKVWLAHHYHSSSSSIIKQIYNVKKYKQIHFLEKKFTFYKSFKKKVRRLQWRSFGGSAPSATSGWSNSENPKGIFLSPWYRN